MTLDPRLATLDPRLQTIDPRPLTLEPRQLPKLVQNDIVNLLL